MSSPDPLNESGPEQTPMSTAASSRRVTRSQASQRTHSFYTSPRKQTFSLDVGNEISPQKILVTVQTEDASDDNQAVNRRLFQSPTPRRATRQRSSSKTVAGTTTTIVPLRGLSDDEQEVATPKRRGRPRKAATPAATRKRPGTPLARKAIEKSRATRSTNNSANNSAVNSDMSADDAQATPRAARATKRKASSPAKEASSSASRPAKRGRPSPPVKEPTSSVTRKRGRPRKAVQEPVQESIEALSEQESTADAEVEDNASVAHTEDVISVAGSQELVHPGADDMEEDVWLATLSDEPTPVARKSHRAFEKVMPEIPEQPTRQQQPEAPRAEPSRSEPPQSEADSMPEGGYDDYQYMGRQSDAESLASDDPVRVEDTVVAEEFTMISVGSLPSMMQLNSSIMGGQPQDNAEEDPEDEAEEEELGEATSLIIHGALESLRQSLNNRTQESAQGNQVPTNAEPVAPEPEQQLERPASKPVSPKVAKQSPRRPTKAQPQPLGRQLALKSLQNNAVDSPARSSGPALGENQEASVYDDSFSEIPEAVLAAATPKKLRKPVAEPEAELPRPDIQPSIERPSSVNHSNPQSETNRLLTPDETPSPIPSEDDHEADAPPGKPSPKTAEEAEMRSSPPVPYQAPVQYPAPERQRPAPTIRHTRTHSYETPVDQPSTYVSPAMALLQAHAAHLAPPDHHLRPTLSPIVRAGRALQAVTSDPPSPPGRGSVLRSPFRSSVPRSQSPPQQQMREPSREVSREPVQEPMQEPELHSEEESSVPEPEEESFQEPEPEESSQESEPEQPREITEATQSPQPAQAESARTERSWFAPLNHLKNFVVQGAQALSPRHASVAGMSDPFAPSPSDATRFSLRNSLFGSVGRQSTNPTAGHEPPAGDEPADDEDDEMSWQAEDAPSQDSPAEEEPRHDSTSGRSNMHDRGQEAALSNEDANEYYENDIYQEPEVQQDQDMADADNGDDYEDDDIWAVEARRSLPSKPKEAAQQPAVSPPRRAKLPSPWRQNSKRLVYKDELRRSIANKSPQKETEDYSLLSQQSRSDKPAAPAGPVAPTKNVDLSAFFSSPAAIPQVDAPFGLSNALDSRKPVHPFQQKAAQQSLRASVAQRTMFPDVNAQESLRASVSHRTQPAITQKDTRQSLRASVAERSLLDDIEEDEQQSDRASVAQRNQLARIQREAQEALEKSTSQRPQAFGHVRPARPSMFRPHREDRQAPSRDFQLGRNLLDVQSPFVPEPTPQKRAAPARQPSPPPSDMSAFSHVPQKMNFTPRTGAASKRLFQPQSKSLFGANPAAVLFGEPASKSNATQRQREITPDTNTLGPRHRAMSPAKSCMRSPLKGKTPGRVVEFTSSTLSPLQQAQVRAERRASNSPEKQLSSGSSTGSRASPVAEDKENLDEEQQQQHTMAWQQQQPEPQRQPQQQQLLQHQVQQREAQREAQRQQRQQQRHQLRLQQQQPIPILAPERPPKATFTKPTAALSPPHRVQKLSHTTWTRDHYVRLNDLLQARRQGALQFQLAAATKQQQQPRGGAADPAVRALLGKEVTAQGEAMALEAWHLEVVEAFRAEVGGCWDPADLAKRLFSLLVGEERRRLGLVPKRR